jgi:DNA-binding CsgD family transcriptional regulator/GAF domain-containing protein
MTALDALLHAIANATTAAQLTSHVMNGIGDALGSEKTGLYLLQPETGRPSDIHVRHLPESFVVSYEQLGREGDRVLAKALHTRRAVYDEQVHPGDHWRQSILYRAFASRYRLRHYLCAPISDGDTILGTLNLGRSSDHAHFDPRTAANATTVGCAIGARLASLAAETSLDNPARLRAVRALLRAGAQLEQTPLSRTHAKQLWRSLAARTAPLDCFDEGGRRYVLLAPSGPAARCAPTLTARERQILTLLAAGESDKAIAFELGVSPSTVSTHLSAVRRKLGVRTRVALVTAARSSKGLLRRRA